MWLVLSILSAFSLRLFSLFDRKSLKLIYFLFNIHNICIQIMWVCLQLTKAYKLLTTAPTQLYGARHGGCLRWLHQHRKSILLSELLYALPCSCKNVSCPFLEEPTKSTIPPIIRSSYCAISQCISQCFNAFISWVGNVMRSIT